MIEVRRNFVDLYSLLQKFSIWDLIEGARIKFGVEYDPFLLASDLLLVNEFKTMPKMILLLTLIELKKFSGTKLKNYD